MGPDQGFHLATTSQEIRDRGPGTNPLVTLQQIQHCATKSKPDAILDRFRSGLGPRLMQSVLDSNDGQFFQHDGIVNGFCHDTIGVNGFSMVFYESTIVFNGSPLASMVIQWFTKKRKL